MINQKKAAIYYHAPLGAHINYAKVVSEIDSIKEQIHQCGLNPVHIFLDKSNSGSMYKTMLDYIADPANNISAFICVTAEVGFTSVLKDKIPLAEERTNKSVDERFTGGGVPYGYTINNSGALVLDEARAAVVLEVFKAKAGGDSLQRIADMLNQRQISSPRGGAWSKAGLSYLLKNRAYLGEYNYEGRIRKIPRAVSHQLYKKCQQV